MEIIMEISGTWLFLKTSVPVTNSSLDSISMIGGWFWAKWFYGSYPFHTKVRNPSPDSKPPSEQSQDNKWPHDSHRKPSGWPNLSRNCEDFKLKLICLTRTRTRTTTTTPTTPAAAAAVLLVANGSTLSQWTTVSTAHMSQKDKLIIPFFDNGAQETESWGGGPLPALLWR